jgi:sulfur carrier protein
MITVFINGYATEVNPKHTLREVVLQASQQASAQSEIGFHQQQQFNVSTIAVAVNQHIVPRSQWAELICIENDRIELYNAVAGG